MGTLAGNATKISDILKEKGISLAVYNVASPISMDENLVMESAKKGIIFTYEDHNINTGLGTTIANIMAENGINAKLYKFGVTNYGFSGKSSDLFKLFKLDVDNMVKAITTIIK